MGLHPKIAVTAGALASAILAMLGAQWSGAPLAQRMDAEAKALIEEMDADGLTARFSTANGWPSRHPELLVSGDLDEGLRTDIAKTIAGIRGVGGVRWSDGTMIAENAPQVFTPLHCQEDVQALLAARTIRFEESSASMQPSSAELLDEVAAALRPCVGAIIAITGHTDISGPEPENIALSQERAIAVRNELVARGIPSAGMRAQGVGSAEPVEGLAPGDPANRRIEFSVIATVPIKPTPIDTPGPR
ncbi:MAG: OmpA family protein [Alteripontixanthobacter sp.]